MLGGQSWLQKNIRDPLVQQGIASPDSMGWKDGKSPYVEPVTATIPADVGIAKANTPVGSMPAATVGKGDLEKNINPDTISDPATVTQTDPNTSTVAKGTTTTPVSPSNPPSDNDWNKFLDQHYATIKSAGLGDKINDIRTGKPADGSASLQQALNNKARDMALSQVNVSPPTSYSSDAADAAQTAAANAREKLASQAALQKALDDKALTLAKQKSPIPSDTGVAKANTPVGSMPAAKTPSIPAGTGINKANTPVGSMPAAKTPSIPAGTGINKANTPVGSMPAASTYTVNKGDNLTKILQGVGQAPTPAAIKAFAAANNIKDPNLIKPGQVLKLPSIKEIMIREYQDFKNKA